MEKDNIAQRFFLRIETKSNWRLDIDFLFKDNIIQSKYKKFLLGQSIFFVAFISRIFFKQKYQK